MSGKPVIRCSSLPQLLNCHGSLTLRALVDDRQGDEGHEGSMIHWKVAHRLITEHGATPPIDGLLGPDVPKGYTIPRMSEWMVDWALRVVADQVPETFAIEVEQEFVAEFDRFILIGHMDLSAINGAGTRFIGLDWKTGYKPVAPASLNDQFLGYICLAKRAWPTLGYAKFIGAQPRNSEEDGFPRISEVELDGAALDACLASLEERVNAALDDPMTVDSSPLACAWCPAATVCPAQRQELEFMKATLSPEFLASIKGQPDDILADLLISSRTVTRAVEDVETTLHERIEAKGSVTASDGTRITLKERAGQYKIINPDGAWAAVQSLVPAARIPQVVKYQKDRLVDEIAAAAGVPKGGNAETTGAKIFDAVVRPNMEQGVSHTLVFSP